MDDIEREVARWDDLQSSVGGEASGPKGLPSPFQRPLIYLPLIMARLSSFYLPFSSQPSLNRHLSSVLYWICPCYDHHSFLETQSKWVLLKEYQAGKLGKLKQYYSDSTPRGEDQLQKSKSSVDEGFHHIWEQNGSITIWVWLLKFQLLACVSVHHQLLGSLRPSSITSPNVFKLGLSSAVSTWYATWHVIYCMSFQILYSAS